MITFVIWNITCIKLLTIKSALAFLGWLKGAKTLKLKGWELLMCSCVCIGLKETAMKMIEMKKGRSPLIAVFLGLAMPGLGQIYNGELVKGVSYFISTMVLLLIGFRLTVFLPDGGLIFGALATALAAIAIYAASIFDAHRKASMCDAAYQLKSYNRWYFYLAIWLLHFVAADAVQQYLQNNCIEAYFIPTNSMQPALIKGDRVLADKTAYRRMPVRKGDIVIFMYPDDRSKKFVKRVEALPGDTYIDADGIKKPIPHGFIYVLGDDRSNSQDSRHFGLVPLRDVVGKVRQIYYSSGRKGFLWTLIGVPSSR
jgi:signal peptidase I